MISVLFWNVSRGSAASFVPSICLENAVDVLILVEDPSPPGAMETAINSEAGSGAYREFAPVPSAVRFYHKLASGTLSAAMDGHRVSIRSFHPTKGSSVLIGAAHLISRLYADELTQLSSAGALRRLIQDAEANAGHKRTIVLGDFNADPFSPLMTAAPGLHATMDKEIAGSRSRSFEGQPVEYFYNPMWSRLGDESHGPTGTFHYAKGGANQIGWHTFDQVLIRPDLLPAYESGALNVITAVGSTQLLLNGKVHKAISDHLPLLLRLEI